MHESQLVKKLDSMRVSQKVTFLESTLTTHPRYFKLRCILAKLLLQQKRMTQAEKHINELLNLKPVDFAAYHLKGELEELKTNDSEAYSAYKKAIELNPQSMTLFKSYFDFLYKTKKYKVASDLLNKVEAQWKNNPNFLSRKAKFLYQKKEIELSKNLFKKAINFAANPIIAGNLAIQFLELIKHEESRTKVEFLKTYVKAYPQHAKLRLKYADELFRENQLQEAEKQLETLLNLVPNHLVALLRKANLLVKKDHPEEAYKLYSKVNELDPSNPWAYVGMERLIFQEGDIAAALELLTSGIAKVKEPGILVFRKANLYISIGSYKLATDLLKKYSGNTSFNPQLHFLLARIHQRKGEFDQARQELKLITSNLSNNKKWNIKANELKAHLAFLEYDYIKAAKLYENLVLSSDKTYNSRNRLALLYLLQGKIDKGSQELKIATREIESSGETGKINIPLIGHASRVINEFNINPRLKSEVQKCFDLKGKDRLTFLAKIQLDNPSYFGSALYLINELRLQRLLSHKGATIKKNTKNEIPKIIVQYWNELEPPSVIQTIMQSWSSKNPSYTHKIFSRQTAKNFIKYHYGYPAAQAFLSCVHPALQADFFRLAYLSKMGGFYADADDRAVKSLEHLRTSNARLVLKLGDFGCISNNFLGAVPGNEILNYTFQKGIENVNLYFNEGPWFKLGPGHLTTCMSYCLSDYIVNNKMDELPNLLVLDQATSRKYLYQHLSLPYKVGDKSWYASEYKRKITQK